MSLEEEPASLLVGWTVGAGGEPQTGNLGLHREPRKAPEPCSAQDGPVTGEGLAVVLTRL